MATNGYTLQELATLTQAEVSGEKNYRVNGVNTLESASSTDVSFLANQRYSEAMKSTHAGVICVDRQTIAVTGKNFLISDDPSRTFQQIVELFRQKSLQSAFTGIHATAVIHESAKIEKNVTIGPYCVIDQQAVIHEGTTLVSHVYVGAEAIIGKDCLIYPHVTIREQCHLGNRVILQPGAVIGSCGFGFTLNAGGKFEKLAQMGNVVIEDDVEIGANTTIDRARFQETRIGQGTKIDNLVQIAHNVKVGPHNAVAAQTGFAGSSETGSHVMMGGQVGIVGHVKIDSFTQLATRSGVSKSLKKGKYQGSPAMDVTAYQRQKVHVRKLESYVERLKSLEQEIQELKNSKTI